MRVSIDTDPFYGNLPSKTWHDLGRWPATWIGLPDAPVPPFFCVFQRVFRIDQTACIRVHVSADERYELFLDGERIGRGPERGAPDWWYFESYDLELSPGTHRLSARVWALGESGPAAQMSVQPGFLLAAEAPWGDLLSTGKADWQVGRMHGLSMLPNRSHLLRGSRFSIDAAGYPWGWEWGAGVDWQAAKSLKPAMGRWINWDFFKDHLLKPSMLPPMFEELLPPGQVCHVDAVGGDEEERWKVPVLAEHNLIGEADQWQRLISHSDRVSVAPNTSRRILLELTDYASAYPELTLSSGSGARVELHWAEALKLRPDYYSDEKGHRDQLEGKYFIGMGDLFLPDGGENRTFIPPWWNAGRFVEISIQTAEEALVVEDLAFRERRYPLEMRGTFTCSDDRLVEIMPIMLRGMQLCSNETFFDCPYYEELMYTGDTRLECLVTYMLHNDDRLPRKALRLFDTSRLYSGMTQSRYPCSITQVISTFALWWVGMLYDFWQWRGDEEFVRQLLPGVRATMQGFRRWFGPVGLLYGAEGWNTIDWVPQWNQDAGVPPEGHTGISGLFNWQYLYTLTLYRDLERSLGDPEQAEWAQRFGAELAQKAVNAFWDDQRGLLADTLDHAHFSEHTQCMALLSDWLDGTMRERITRNLFTDTELDRTTIYFSHYYFEVCRLTGRMDAFMARMGLWFYLKEMGFKTPVESPEPSRSDCHAWSSHPLFHYYATILGIRPLTPGLSRVEIAPQLGELTWAEGRMPHPNGGEIAVNVHRDGDQLEATLELPENVVGVLCWGGEMVELPAGVSQVKLGKN